MPPLFLRSIILAALFWLVGCTAPPAPLRIGTNPWSGYEFLQLALELGYFREEGVAVKLVDAASLAASRRAFENGEVDVFGATVVELLLAHENAQHREQAFFVTDVSQGADVLLARKPIRRVADLKGRRIGIEPGSLDALVTYHALKQGGLQLSDVSLVPLAQSAMRDAVASGRIDALPSYPPVSTEIVRGGLASVVFDSRQAPNAIVDVLVADAELIKRRPRELAAVARAFERARLHAAAEPAAALKILTRRSGMTAVEMREALAGLRLVPLAEQAAFLAQEGALHRALDDAAQVMTETRLLKPEAGVAHMFSAAVVP